MLDGHVDLNPCLGREGGPRGGLDVEPEAVLVLQRTQALHARPKLVLSAEKVGPRKDDRSVELAFADLQKENQRKLKYKKLNRVNIECAFKRLR